ncbi:MAG TPA: hypothetical protein VNX18_13685 [Bryobacteraceae bacterium]|nr:hypothetical protein [Bryobacteraceae bacterium]
MSIDVPAGVNSQPFDWADLVAGIRSGDEEAVWRLGNIFQDGIRSFLRRGLGQHKLQSRQREVLSQVIQSIRETPIDNPNCLASHVLTVLRQYISSQMMAGPSLVLDDESRVNMNDIGAIRDLLAKIAAVDREALRRYYVDQETSEQVCQALNLPATRFLAVTSTIRTAVTPRGCLNR